MCPGRKESPIRVFVLCETDTASGLQYDMKYLKFSSPPFIITAGFKPPLRLISMIRSLRWDIYLITAAPHNSSSWQLKANPSLGYCYTRRYHQSVISMHSRRYSVIKWFNLHFSWTPLSFKLPRLIILQLEVPTYPRITFFGVWPCR